MRTFPSNDVIKVMRKGTLKFCVIKKNLYLSFFGQVIIISQFLGLLLQIYET